MELIWSLKSGKTRVHWNGRNISNFFREGNRSRKLEFGWETGTGKTIKVEVYAEQETGVEHQYNLVIEGISFFDLPRLDEFKQQSQGEKGEAVDQTSTPPSAEHENIDLPEELGYEIMQSRSLTVDQTRELPPSDNVSELGCSEVGTMEEAVRHESEDTGNFDYRLSLVGINTGVKAVEVVDELVESDCCTPLVNQMRSEITSYLPQTEETVSKAITNALFADSDSSGPSECSVDDRSYENDPARIEATSLLEAVRWVREKDSDVGSENEELALSFMQKQIENAFLSARQGVITATQACRMLLNVGAILGFEFSRPIPTDTLVLDGLPNDTEPDLVRDSLNLYGGITGVGILRNCGFGFVRFEDEQGAIKAQSEAEGLTFLNSQPQVVVISDKVHEEILIESDSDAKHESCQTRLILGVPPGGEPKDSVTGETEASTVSTMVQDGNEALGSVSASPDTVTRMVEPSLDSLFKPEHPAYTSMLD